MSTTAAVELDLLGTEKSISVKSSHHNPTHQNEIKLLDRPRSFRDIQSVISKLNPALLKSVIASGTRTGTGTGITANNSSSSSFSNCMPLIPYLPKQKFSSTPKMESPDQYFPALPVSSTPNPNIRPETTPLTIFYKGSVAVFDIPRHKAENILKLAHGGGGGFFKKLAADDPMLIDASSNHHPQQQQLLLEELGGDLPIARKKSLQRFLQKRKERLTSVLPYGYSTAFSSQKT